MKIEEKNSRRIGELGETLLEDGDTVIGCPQATVK